MDGFLENNRPCTLDASHRQGCATSIRDPSKTMIRECVSLQNGPETYMIARPSDAYVNLPPAVDVDTVEDAKAILARWEAWNLRLQQQLEMDPPFSSVCSGGGSAGPQSIAPRSRSTLYNTYTQRMDENLPSAPLAATLPPFRVAYCTTAATERRKICPHSTRRSRALLLKRALGLEGKPLGRTGWTEGPEGRSREEGPVPTMGTMRSPSVGGDSQGGEGSDGGRRDGSCDADIPERRDDDRDDESAVQSCRTLSVAARLRQQLYATESTGALSATPSSTPRHHSCSDRSNSVWPRPPIRSLRAFSECEAERQENVLVPIIPSRLPEMGEALFESRALLAAIDEEEKEGEYESKTLRQGCEAGARIIDNMTELPACQVRLTEPEATTPLGGREQSAAYYSDDSEANKEEITSEIIRAGKNGDEKEEETREGTKEDEEEKEQGEREEEEAEREDEEEEELKEEEEEGEEEEKEEEEMEQSEREEEEKEEEIAETEEEREEEKEEMEQSEKEEEEEMEQSEREEEEEAIAETKEEREDEEKEEEVKEEEEEKEEEMEQSEREEEEEEEITETEEEIKEEEEEITETEEEREDEEKEEEVKEEEEGEKEEEITETEEESEEEEEEEMEQSEREEEEEAIAETEGEREEEEEIEIEEEEMVNVEREEEEEEEAIVETEGEREEEEEMEQSEREEEEEETDESERATETGLSDRSSYQVSMNEIIPKGTYILQVLTECAVDIQPTECMTCVEQKEREKNKEHEPNDSPASMCSLTNYCCGVDSADEINEPKDKEDTAAAEVMPRDIAPDVPNDLKWHPNENNSTYSIDMDRSTLPPPATAAESFIDLHKVCETLQEVMNATQVLLDEEYTDRLRVLFDECTARDELWHFQYSFERIRASSAALREIQTNTHTAQITECLQGALEDAQASVLSHTEALESAQRALESHRMEANTEREAFAAREASLCAALDEHIATLSTVQRESRAAAAQALEDHRAALSSLEGSLKARHAEQCGRIAAAARVAESLAAAAGARSALLEAEVTAVEHRARRLRAQREALTDAAVRKGARERAAVGFARWVLHSVRRRQQVEIKQLRREAVERRRELTLWKNHVCLEHTLGGSRGSVGLSMSCAPRSVESRLAHERDEMREALQKSVAAHGELLEELVALRSRTGQ